MEFLNNTSFDEVDDGGVVVAETDAAAAASTKTPGKEAEKPDTTEKVPAVSNPEADFEARLQAEKEKAVAEALALDKMKPDEKAAYEQKQRIAALELREQAAAQKELKLNTLGVLADKGLDKEFLDYVLADDAAGTAKKIDAFKSVFDKAVQAQVETRLKGKTPPAGNAQSESDSIRNQFKQSLGGF